MGLKTCRVGLVVIGKNHQSRISPKCFCRFYIVNRLACAVGAATGNDWDTALVDFNGGSNDSSPFIAIKGRGFTSGPAGHKSMDTGLNLAFDKGFECVEIHFAIREWGHKGCAYT